ncbi:HAD family hydrolase [Halomarina halobia]|uniref:HAD family hydrolase n=1 Tax=Halomarina halobia TaxID=3033386 RepID=A0ABD6A6N8_9EURY|nr:HAD-IA family hydrolase [Halomarina sp. PSR21]
MDAVCFDMDGVIVDSERHWAPLENERILPRAVESGTVTASDITGMNVADLHAHLAEEYGTTMSEAAFVALYDEAAEELYTERVALIEGFEPLCERLGERGAALSIVSSSPRRWIRFVLDRFDLRGAFDAVVSAEDVDGPSKPAPDVYERAAARLDAAPERCVAVEDSAHGVAAATAAGMYCVGYRTDANESQDLSAADAIAAGPAALRERVEALCA